MEIFKNKIIQTENYLLIVSDEEIKEGDYITTCGDVDDGGLIAVSKYRKDHLGVGQKITGHLPLNNAPVLKGVPLLPKLDIDMDIELKLGKLHHHLQDIKDYEGVRQIQEIIVTKSLYNEDDLRSAFDRGEWDGCGKSELTRDNVFKELINSIKKTKYPKFFIPEIIEGKQRVSKAKDGSFYESGYNDDKFKTTKNPQGQTVLIGTYKYK